MKEADHGQQKRRDLKYRTAAEAAKKADIIMILINDEKQAALYKNSISSRILKKCTRCLHTALTFISATKRPPANVDVTMIAPKSPDIL